MSEQPSEPRVKREFLVDRQGRQFILYAGLLDLAHQDGLKRIETQLVQQGNQETENTWVFKATVETSRGIFTGYGDANPSNVSKAMLTAIIRMAETRAKARALRDAVNVGTAALEELGTDVADDDATRAIVVAKAPPNPTPSHQKASERQTATSAHTKATGTTSIPGYATAAQLRAIFAMAKGKQGLSDAEVRDRIAALYNVQSPEELTLKQASELIKQFQG